MVGYSLELLRPLGAIVHGLDLAHGRPSNATLAALERDAADRGFLVFRDAALPGASLLSVSEYFGSGSIAAQHTAHASSVHEDILRLSNDESHGISGVGPQWHSDGSFERRIFSHVLFHAQQMPAGGGSGTQFADLAAAHAALSPRQQDEWSRLATVNSYSGAVHPLVVRHPRSGKRSLCVHLGMVGAVIRWPHAASPALNADRCAASLPAGYRTLEAMDAGAGPTRSCGHELLTAHETRTLLRKINALLSRPEHSTEWGYSAHAGGGDDRRQTAGDLVVVDNLAVAHRATTEAHEPGMGLRILHRTTVQGTWEVDAPMEAHLPPFAFIWGGNPLTGADGYWRGADHYGVGMRWNDSCAFRN